MTRQLLWASAVVLAGAGMALTGACKTDVETNPITTSTTTSSTSSTGGGGTAGSGGDTGGTGGTGAVGGGGTGGTPEPSGTDTCPGDPYVLNGPTSYFLTGDTTLGVDDYQSFCGNATGPDMVYALDVQTAGTLKLSVSSTSSLDPVLYIQQGTCGDAASSIWCADFNFPASPTTESIATAVTPGTYYVVVDGSAASGGTYTLNVNFTAAACGDSVVNVSEECDDGNALANDGCANCSLETGQFEDCANPEVAPVSANTPIFLHGWTTANLDDLSGSTDCVNSPAEGCGSNDRVVLVMPADSGTLTATIGMDKFNIDNVCATSPYPDPILDPACWDRVLYAYQGPNPATCGGPGYITLGAGVNLGDPVTISFPVVAGSSYFIVVDGYYGNDPPGYESGEYWLHLNLQ